MKILSDIPSQVFRDREKPERGKKKKKKRKLSTNY